MYKPGGGGARFVEELLPFLLRDWGSGARIPRVITRGNWLVTTGENSNY